MVKRKSYGKIKESFELPPMVAMQLDSYAAFLQLDVPKKNRKNEGLEELFNETFPIESADGKKYEIRNRVTLCRCGKSNNKPFCDGNHLQSRFNDGDKSLKG